MSDDNFQPARRADVMSTFGIVRSSEGVVLARWVGLISAMNALQRLTSNRLVCARYPCVSTLRVPGFEHCGAGADRDFRGNGAFIMERLSAGHLCRVFLAEGQRSQNPTLPIVGKRRLERHDISYRKLFRLQRSRVTSRGALL